MSNTKQTDLLKLAESGTNVEIEIYLGSVNCKQFREDVKNVTERTSSVWIFVYMFCAVVLSIFIVYFLFKQ